MLIQVQRGLEQLYRLEPKALVDSFLISEEERALSGVNRSPREQLLLHEDDEGLSVGLFVHPAVIEDVQGRAPRDLIARSLGNFLMVLEGVSHFVYVAHKAQCNHQVSALELELQAEVDKYVTCLLSIEGNDHDSKILRTRLFEDFEYEENLDEHEQCRYRVANENAMRYSASLEKRYIKPRRIDDMLAELRRFYRLGLAHKLEFISRAA